MNKNIENIGTRLDKTPLDNNQITQSTDSSKLSNKQETEVNPDPEQLDFGFRSNVPYDARSFGLNVGGGVVKYTVCIGYGFAGYCGGGGVYVCGCCAVIENIAKRSSNFASISAIFASARVALSILGDCLCE